MDKNLTPTPAEADDDGFDVTRHPAFAGDPDPTVRTRARYDGWTPEKQRRFLVALAEIGVVREAAAAAGMSPESAYRLRRRPEAQAFRLAWDAAIDHAMGRIADALADRALNGVEIPHYYKGELVGTHRRHDNRLAQWLLRRRAHGRFGAAAEKRPLETPDAPAQRLDLLLYAVGKDVRVHPCWWSDRSPAAAKRLVHELAGLEADAAVDRMLSQPGWSPDDEWKDPKGHAAGGDAA